MGRKKGKNDGTTGMNNCTSKKWLGVRLSRVMMAQIAEVLRSHPEYAWSTPNDFVRDAVRRLLEHVGRQEALSKLNIEVMQSSARQVVEETIGASAGNELAERLKAIEESKFDEQFLESLTDMLGKKVAKGVIEKLRERAKEGNAEKIQPEQKEASK